MNIRIGDTVKFISEKLEGKVTGIIDNNTVNVYCDVYGFEIPASVHDLVVVYSDFTPAISGQENRSVQKNIQTDSSDSLFLCIVPEHFQDLPGSRFEIYLVNDTALICLYQAGYFDGETYKALSAGNCNPDTSLLLGTYSLKELERLKSVHIQALFYRKGTYVPRPVVDVHVKINPVSLCKSGSYQHVKWFNSLCFIKSLDKEPLAKEEILAKEWAGIEKVKKEENIVTRRPQKQVVNNVVEIDLHCDQLLETTAGMENKDILEYQLEIFRKTLDEYKLRKGQKIVFIHGKGDGVLRQRILWELQTKYKRLHHQDASFKQYGYGATMVTIK